MKSGNNPLSRKHDIVIQELRDEILIYDLTKNKALCLNETSSMIWQACDGTKSVADISQILSKKLKSNVSEDIVWLALNQFKTDNLLAESKEFVTPLDGLTRREVVKRIGFASMVALPVISALVAPTALHAQSLCGETPFICIPAHPPGGVGGNINPPGCPCGDDGDCAADCFCGGTCVLGPVIGVGGVNCTSNCDNNRCAGTCVGGGNSICVGGQSELVCIPGNTGGFNPPCCPCASPSECFTTACVNSVCVPGMGN